MARFSAETEANHANHGRKKFRSCRKCVLGDDYGN